MENNNYHRGGVSSNWTMSGEDDDDDGDDNDGDDGDGDGDDSDGDDYHQRCPIIKSIIRS